VQRFWEGHDPTQGKMRQGNDRGKHVTARESTPTAERQQVMAESKSVSSIQVLALDIQSGYGDCYYGDLSRAAF